MEGPSLYLAAEQLKPFVKKAVLEVSGNTKFGMERVRGQEVKKIFSWGKHLVFQFEAFAMRVHFLLWGSFAAVVDGKSVTGDYKKEGQNPRLALRFKNGEIKMYSCSLKYLEGLAASQYDFSGDVLSKDWNPKQAHEKLRSFKSLQIADVLLDQDVFAGVGNIIKNEILFQALVHPESLVGDLPLAKQKELIKRSVDYSWQFYEWRKKFELRKHYQIYRRVICPICGGKVQKKKNWSQTALEFYLSN